jgi:hypothetical protein
MDLVDQSVGPFTHDDAVVLGHPAAKMRALRHART